MLSEKQIPLKNVVGMDYEPRNEAGVIILFALLMKRLNFSGVVEAQKKFPDCIGRRQGQRVSIEFEYKSKTFITHGHLEELGRKKCTIICWEDNWAKPPRNIEIISLSKKLGISNRVRLAHAKAVEDIEFLDNPNRKTVQWSMPKATKKGDLILIWRAGAGQSKFQDILLALEDASPKRGYSGYGNCKILCHLKNPIALKDIKRHKELKRTSLAKQQFYQGMNNELTPYWPYVYELIIDRNSNVRKILKTFTPGIFTI